MRLARNAAFAKLLPLVWSQLRDQAEHYFEFLNMGQTVGLYTAEQMRAGEDLNGWLQLRTRETGEANEGTGTVRDAFCALSKNVLMIYKDEDAGVGEPPHNEQRHGQREGRGHEHEDRQQRRSVDDHQDDEHRH